MLRFFLISFGFVLALVPTAAQNRTNTILAVQNITRNSLLQTPAQRRFVNLATRKCLDSTADGRAYTLNCNNGNFQFWVWNDDLTIRNVATRRCLDTNGPSLFTNNCNTGSYQKWSSLDRLVFTNVAIGECLDSNQNGEAYPHYCNGDGFQIWTE